MDRITRKHLDALALRINKLTGSPETYMDADHKIRVGNYHVSGAYGGWCLHRTMNTGGGVNTPIGMGHVPARELYERMNAFIKGIECGREMAGADHAAT